MAPTIFSDVLGRLESARDSTPHSVQPSETGLHGQENGTVIAEHPALLDAADNTPQLAPGIHLQHPAAETAFDHNKDHSDMVRLVADCDDALESLMLRHARRLLSQLVRILRNQTEAKECVAEAFVRVYHHRQAFHPQAKFSTWLYTIAFNLARDRLRRQARRPEFVSLEDHDEQDVGDLQEVLLDPSRAPDEAMVSQERSRWLAEAIATLPDALRLPLVLFAEEDKSQPEIAAEMHCTVKAVEMRLYHAHKRLHSLLKREFKEYEGFSFLKRSSS
jgi:RNA polymerase sigma-70 factor (ECF subfamily)